MKLKKIISAVIVCAIALASLSITGSAAYELSDPDYVIPICKMNNIPIIKNGETKTVSLIRPEKTDTGWFYSIPVTSTGKVTVDITADNGITTTDVLFVAKNAFDKDLYTYRIGDYSDSFIKTKTGTVSGLIVYGDNKSTQIDKMDKIQYYAFLQYDWKSDTRTYSGSLTFDVEKGEYILGIYSDENKNGTATITVTYPDGKASTLSSVKGDADNNGKVSLSDALMVLKHANGSAKVKNTTMADFDGNGSITMTDALRILKLANNI